ncbi:Sterol uptake control protein 2 [Smittium culicis]|uniref:Sterol uptake control protein 2 n=1 Tax=Smittium culicis TaxID=133412 RepID=A0A1R1XFJ2_9FUNG|nr:Sterol uptake control protein 2 [Smittium culicis]
MSSSFSLANSSDFNSKLKSFTALKYGKAFHSCEMCRKKRIKCDGERPVCGICIRFNRNCNYQELSKPNEILTEIKRINSRILRIRKYIRNTPPEIIALYRRDNSDFISEKNIKNPFQNYFKKNTSKRKSAFSIKLEENSNCIQNKAKLLDSVFNSSSLELGSYDAKDEFPKDLIDIIFSKSTVSLVLSKSYFLWRLKNNMVQDFMKYTLMTFGVKLLRNLDYFKEHIYMAGSTYANKALELLNSKLHEITVDKIFCLMLLSIHFMDTSDNLKSVQLSGKI